jgi:hypothetical protein
VWYFSTNRSSPPAAAFQVGETTSEKVTQITGCLVMHTKEQQLVCVCGRLETAHHSFSRWNIFFFDATQKEQAKYAGEARYSNCVTFFFPVPFFARMANKQT